MGLLSRLFSPKQRTIANARPAPAAKPFITPDPAKRAGDRWYVPTDNDKARFIGNDGLPSLRLIRYQDTNGEHVLRLCENDTGLLVGPTDTRLPHADILVSNLRGTAHHKTACRRGNFSPGAAVRLVPEPDNPHDNRAVAVYDASGQHLCAYMNKQKARAYLKRVAAGEELEAISIRWSEPGQACAQVSVLAATPEVLKVLRSARPSGAPKPAHRR